MYDKSKVGRNEGGKKGRREGGRRREGREDGGGKEAGGGGREGGWNRVSVRVKHVEAEGPQPAQGIASSPLASVSYSYLAIRYCI